MPDKKRKQILIGLDGSERSLHTVEYVSRIPAFRLMNVVLFSVYSEIPEAYWDLQKMPLFKDRIGEIHAWETQSRDAMEEKLREAQRMLVEAGIPERQVILRNHKLKQGIARDLIKEARKFNALAVGRRSSGKIKELMLGSVAAKLLEKVDFTPLILVGKEADADGILVTMDGSPNSIREVRYLAGMMRGSSARVRLFHVVRGTDKKLIQADREAIEEVFEKALEKLSKAGFGPDQVSTKIVTGVESRAAAIVGEARMEGFKTIVIGRRGLSRLQQFFMGRVSKKVVYLARGLAGWVVN